MAEYCGAEMAVPELFTAEYLSGVGEPLAANGHTDEYFFSTLPDSFFWLFEQNADIFRSVWDRNSMLGIIDMEYFNLTYPAEAYFNPKRTFNAIEPIYKRIKKILRKFGITSLAIMTGQGYHFSFRVDSLSPIYLQLISLGKLGETLVSKYRSPHGTRPKKVPMNAGLAFDGMGRLLEYLTHLVLLDLWGNYAGIPVVCTDVSVGKSREAIAIDLSMYADPLHTRDIRCPFSTYQKHRIYKEKFGARAAEEVPVFVTLPRISSKSLSKLLKMRFDFSECQKYASEVKTIIPESSAGVARLIRSYRASKLFQFHEYFDSAKHDPPQIWQNTYDRFDLGILPPCAAHCLYFPNDNLLKPTNIQTLTRILIKLGWHPNHIAGLIRSKLERNFGWGSQWHKYDTAARAGFYVRLFSGLIAAGIDNEEDLNCFSHREKGYCLQKDCFRNLADHRLISDFHNTNMIFPGFGYREASVPADKTADGELASVVSQL